MIVLLVIVALVGIAAWRYGADSRDGRDWKPASFPPAARNDAYRRDHSLRRDLAAIHRLLSRSATAHHAQADRQGRHAQAHWLRWTRTEQGWRLTGSVLPPHRRDDEPPTDAATPRDPAGSAQ